MKTQMSPTAGPSSDANVPEPVLSLSSSAWYRSLWFDLAIALLAGLAYALLVMGPRPLNPRNVNWIAFDPAYHYIGWELYRQDPHLHWPLTYTDRLGYPKGESVALLDLNPLMALVLKPVSSVVAGAGAIFRAGSDSRAARCSSSSRFGLLRMMMVGPALMPSARC